MKACKWIVRALIAIAVLLILLAVLSLLFDLQTGGINKISFFHAANSFLLMAIALFLLTNKHCCCCCKDKQE